MFSVPSRQRPDQAMQLTGTALHLPSAALRFDRVCGCAPSCSQLILCLVR